MLFSDLALSRRLEAAEGYACMQFALARRKVLPYCGSETIRIAGVDVTFDGAESPVTQTFGMGMLEDPTPGALEEIEAFFAARESPVQHEVSPFAGVATLQLLCARGYAPFELSSVLYQPIESRPAFEQPPGIEVRVIGSSDAELWTGISARGWAHEHPEFEGFMREIGTLLTSREGSACFLALVDGTPAAAGALSIYRGVALFAGASTVPEHRRRGLQSALLAARMDYAREQGCDLAMMVAEPGSNSQRNAQRQGFAIAYTRVKWRRDSR